MALPPGTRLGPYEIAGPLGSGGMGDVYRATDTRLSRPVAIKVLPASLAGDVERRQRFEREARIIASLSHPHICAVHDVGVEAGGMTEPLAYLVMEYLEGETLAARLARGALPPIETARIGADIAAALAAAHRAHIVHRDLKPANVMLTRAGVKLLDFGIAKGVDPGARPGGALSTKALTVATAAGTTLGTMPYMSPEQLEGRGVDVRSDIFALGAVLYEMATGRRAFPGESYAAVSAAVLHTHPPPIAEAPALERIVRPCLEKDPDRRWQSAQDVALQLLLVGDRDPSAPAPQRGRRAPWMPWAIAGAAVVAAPLAFSAGRLATVSRAPAMAGPTVTFAIPPPGPDGSFLYHVEWPGVSVSPDGSHVVFAAAPRGAEPRLWLRPLASLDARPIEGTEGATSSFWSPDGRSLAFFALGKLKRVPLAGGTPVPICDVQRGLGLGGTWGIDGTILYASVEGDAIFKVPADGGVDPVAIVRPDRSRKERRVMWPSFLPDGRSFLYLTAFDDDSGAVMLGREGGQPQELIRAKSTVQYVEPGYLFYVQEGVLLARRFDSGTGRLSGEPLAVATPVVHFHATGQAQYAASRNGVVVFQSHANLSRIVQVDRNGKETMVVREPGGYQSIRLSDNGRQLVFERAHPQLTTLDVFVLELDRGAETQITHESGTEAFPLFGPDATLIYAAARGRPPRLHRRRFGAADEAAIGPDAPGLQLPTDLSRDGKWLLYSQRTPRGDFDIHALRLSDGHALTLRDTPVTEGDARFSPDGRQVAFSAADGGNTNVYVMPFETGAARRAVSTGGGFMPRWSADGSRLFFFVPADEPYLMSVPITFVPSFEIGKATRLFSLPAGRTWNDYQPLADGRFLAVQNVQSMGKQPMTVIANWRPQP